MYPLFKGATRLPTFLGVPRQAAIGTLIFGAVVWLWFKFYALPIVALIWFVEFTICKKDDRMFRVVWVFARTKAANRLRTRIDHRRFKNDDIPQPHDIWNGSSYSPMSNVRDDQ